MPSIIMQAAARKVAQLREEYELYREAQYQAADNACNGYLLNERGRRAHVNPWSLFIGSTDRALLYASDELRDYWRDHPRMTFAEYERTHWDGVTL